MTHVGKITLNEPADWPEIVAAKRKLEKKGATSIRIYVGEKSGEWGYVKVLSLNGYKDD